MEIKNYFPSPFVRHGFGRVSTTSKSSSSHETSHGTENYNSLEEMGQSEVEETHTKTTVKHCISKFNSNSTPTEGKAHNAVIFLRNSDTSFLKVFEDEKHFETTL